MELRLVDPRTLRDNPKNPRRTAPNEIFEAQFLANVKELGIIQPPVVREKPEGLTISAGHRRKYAAIAAGLPEIWVLVRDNSDGHDGMRALSENLIRSGMCAVDIWRSIEAQIGDGWSEEGIATALALPPRTIRKFRLLGNIHPALLDRMAQGDEPSEEHLRAIAGATREEQAAVWKKHKPKKNERVEWWKLANALKKRRLPAKVARFDDALAQAFGIRWTEDLFQPAGEDARYTDQIDEFLAAQHEWLVANLPKNAQLLELDDHGSGKLPARAQESWSSKPGKGDIVGTFVCQRSGEVKQRIFRLPEPSKQSGKADTRTSTPRPDISGTGVALIGDMRTEALHTALQEAPIDDVHLLGLLVLAISGDNVRVEQDPSHYRTRTARDQVAARVTEGGVLTSDLRTVRSAAREMLRTILSCKIGSSGSGTPAQIAGTVIGADGYLPNMATEDFLKTLSKAGVERAVRAQGLAPRNTGKEMRAALINRVGERTYIHPAAMFPLTDAERRVYAEHQHAAQEDSGTAEEPGDLDGEETDFGPDTEAAEEHPIPHPQRVDERQAAA